MSPELKIIFYLFFVISLFFIDNPVFYGDVFVVIFFLLFTVPVKVIKRGWIPILILLMFTFFSNLLFRHGKVLFTAGPLIVTDEGWRDASVKTMRVLFMILGAKLLTGTTPVESLIRAFGRILQPLQHVGIPVNDFVSTMGLTIRSLPALKEQFLCIYRERMRKGTVCGFWNRTRVVAGAMMPFFVQSIQAPEQFLKETGKSGK